MTIVVSPGYCLLLLTLVCVAFDGKASRAQSVEPSFVLPPLEELDAIVDRPLFSPDRRPLARESAPEADDQPAGVGSIGGQLLLAGTATDQGNRAVAILYDVAQGMQYRVSVGDRVAGWTVQAIRPREIVLVNATRQVTVTLDEPAFPESAVGR